MRYNSDSVMSLDRIKQDYEVTKKLVVENAPRHIGYNIEMKRVARLARMDIHTNEPYYL